MTSPILDELSLSQVGIVARACSVHKQMLTKQVKLMPDGWKKDETMESIDDLRVASDILARREQELLSE